jgi:hypothetical protein
LNDEGTKSTKIESNVADVRGDEAMIVKPIAACLMGFALAQVMLGCNSGGAGMDEMASTVEAQKAVQQQEEAARKAEEARKAAAAASAPPAEPQVEAVTAHSPKKGRSLEGGGYLSVVTGTRFWAEHQIILDNIHHAMQLYQAEHGEYPKTQEEFMQKIIKPNEPSTRLPELPEGWEYFYDPQEPLVLKMKNTGTGQPNAVQ